jgi:hypothetical protein
MSEEDRPAELPVDEPPGWRVIDPDGNVVGSGPGVALEMVTQMGEQEEEADDGGDR